MKRRERRQRRTRPKAVVAREAKAQRDAVTLRRGPKGMLPPVNTDVIWGSTVDPKFTTRPATLDDFRIPVSDRGADWISMVSNPFGSNEREGKTLMERPPDGDSQFTHLCLVRGSCRISYASIGNNTSCVIQLHGHAVTGTTADQDLVIYYGNDATSPTDSPTGVQEAFNECYVNFAGNQWTSNDKGRIVSAGLRVNGTGLDTEAAVLQAYETNAHLRYAAGTYNTYATALARSLDDSRNLKQGITMRKSLDSNWSTYVTAPANNYSAATSVFGEMPCIQVSGMSTTTVLVVDWVIVYETITRAKLAVAPARSGFEKEFNALVHYINQQPQVVDGHTFRPFSAIWKGIKTSAKWAWENGLRDIAKSGMGAVSRKAQAYTR